MRWSIAVLTSIAVVALIYHNAVPRTQRWHIVLPGAALATGMWFRGHFAVRMLSKSLYRLRCHLRFLGVGIALLVWMYLLSFVVRVGVEFNAVLFPRAVACRPKPLEMPQSPAARLDLTQAN